MDIQLIGKLFFIQERVKLLKTDHIHIFIVINVKSTFLILINNNYVSFLVKNYKNLSQILHK